jgi:hypothetical protein
MAFGRGCLLSGRARNMMGRPAKALGGKDKEENKELVCK